MISNPNRAECKLYNVLKALNTFYTIMDNTKWSFRRQPHYICCLSDTQVEKR